jgi:hypothetical protein
MVSKESGVKAPGLQDLRERQCSPEELQAALVQLIELHNSMHDEINKMILDGRIRSHHEASMNTIYGLP